MKIKMAANCVYCHRITERDTFAMLNIFFNYQHKYMGMLIIIRMIYILQKNEIELLPIFTARMVKYIRQQREGPILI